MNKYLDSTILPKINVLIKRKHLTDCLELLENLGYTGDSAILMIGSEKLWGGS